MIKTKAVVDMFRSAGGRIFVVGDQQETMVSSKTVPENLNLKFRSKFIHGFANNGCLHCAILKALYGFKEKRAHKARDF